MNKDSTDERILSKIRTNTNDQQRYFQELYRRHYRPVEVFIMGNKGSKDDAKDIFQEVMLVLLAKLNDPSFQLTASVGTYIYAVARNLWLNRLKENGRLNTCELYEQCEESPEEVQPQTEQRLTIWLKMITKHCQAILKAIFFMKMPIMELAAKNGWKNKHTAQNQKYKCLQQVRSAKEKTPSDD